MKKFHSLLQRILLVALVLSCLMVSVAAAEGKVKVTDKALVIPTGDDSGYFFAKIENVGDAPIVPDSGDLVLFSEDDDIILSSSYITTFPSFAVLEPGDYLYVQQFLWDSALENATVGDYKFSAKGRDRGNAIVKYPCEATFDLAQKNKRYIYVTFTNPTSENLEDLYVSAAVYDAEGALLFVEETLVSSISVHPNSTITVELYVNNDTVEYYNANGIVPATVDAIVCTQAD